MRITVGYRLMRILMLMLCLTPFISRAQTVNVPAPVPEDEVFKREDIGHALAAPTPEAGHTAASAANAPEEDGQWTMPSKNYASTRFSGLKEIEPRRMTPLHMSAVVIICDMS